MKAEEFYEDLEIFILNNEDDFDRGKGKYLLREFIKKHKTEQGSKDIAMKIIKIKNCNECPYLSYSSRVFRNGILVQEYFCKHNNNKEMFLSFNLITKNIWHKCPLKSI